MRCTISSGITTFSIVTALPYVAVISLFLDHPITLLDPVIEHQFHHVWSRSSLLSFRAACRGHSVVERSLRLSRWRRHGRHKQRLHSSSSRLLRPARGLSRDTLLQQFFGRQCPERIVILLVVLPTTSLHVG
jgi:hypothetical protein